jgi:hypothetical protein
VLVDGDARVFEVTTQHRMSTHLVDDLADASEELGIIQRRLADGNAIPTQLARFTHQARRVRKRPDGNWTIVGGHAAKAVAGDQCRVCAKFGGAQGSDHTSWPGADHDDVHHALRFNIASLFAHGGRRISSHWRITRAWVRLGAFTPHGWPTAVLNVIATSHTNKSSPRPRSRSD